jgi:hypothetical protein
VSKGNSHSNFVAVLLMVCANKHKLMCITIGFSNGVGSDATTMLAGLRGTM